MAAINPDHLFDQADAFVAPSGIGAARQTDLRRAVSAAYYALFHAILTAAADEAVGASRRADPLWALAYRSVTHRWLKELCIEIPKPTMPSKYRPYRPASGFGNHVETIARAVLESQTKRHAADYDPLVRVSRLDVLTTIKTAKSAVRRLEKLRRDRRKAFLYLVLFQPR